MDCKLEWKDSGNYPETTAEHGKVKAKAWKKLLGGGWLWEVLVDGKKLRGGHESGKLDACNEAQGEVDYYFSGLGKVVTESLVEHLAKQVGLRVVEVNGDLVTLVGRGKSGTYANTVKSRAALGMADVLNKDPWTLLGELDV